MLSNRFQKHCDAPDLLLEPSEKSSETFQSQADFAANFKWASESYDVYFVLDSGRIKLIKFQPYNESDELKLEKRGIINSFLKLLIGRSRTQMLGLSFREWENFLRDQNDLPALSPDFASEIGISDTVFKDWCLSLIKGMGIALAGGAESKQVPNCVSGTEEATLVERIRWMDAYLKQVIAPVLILDGGGVDLLDWQFGEIVLAFKGTCRDCPGLEEGTLAFVRHCVTRDIPSRYLESSSGEVKVVAQRL